MDEEKKEEIQEETNEESNEEVSEDNREEETRDEIRDEAYVNDDEVEMLRKLEKSVAMLSDKVDSILSMQVDSGALVQDSVEEITENERKDYEDDFINIDEMDLSL